MVWTGDNRVFFFNPSTKTSLWECPAELKNKSEVAELTKAPPKTKDSSQITKRPSEDEQEEIKDKKTK